MNRSTSGKLGLDRRAAGGVTSVLRVPRARTGFGSRSGRAVVAVAMVLAIAGVSAPTQAAPSPKANATADESATLRELMRTGVAEYKKGNLQAARDAFLQAWKLKPHYAIAASLAEVEIALGQARSAAEHLEYYLANLPDELEDKRAAAEEELAECRKRLADVRVTVDVPDATVYVDGERVVLSKDNDVWIEPGPHTFMAEQGGVRSKPKDLVFVAGETREVRLEVREHEPPASLPAPTSAPAPKPAEPKEPAARPPAFVLIGGSALALVAIGVGVGFTLDARAAQSDADAAAAETAAQSGQSDLIKQNAQCAPPPGAPPPPPACQTLRDDLDRSDRSHDIALGAFIGGGVVAVGTALTYFLWPAGKPKSDRVGVRVAPWIGGAARGTSLSVDF